MLRTLSIEIVSTKKINPADNITRGMSVKDIQNLTHWWSGPKFLGKIEDE